VTPPPYVPLSDNDRVLVVVAHPDDIDFGAAGTIATFTAAGRQVTYCLITDGDAGGFDDAVDRTEIPAIRQREQRAAVQARAAAWQTEELAEAFHVFGTA